MLHGERTTIDLVTDKHELMTFRLDPDDGDQILQIEHDGRTLRVIVPLFYDETRVGEVVASAVVGEIVFLLCRHDKPDDYQGVLGLLVVALPHADGRHRAVIAHTTYSLERLGLYPVPTSPG